ncbi:MAG: hypothetical protein ACYC0N_01210 [Carboxydocellales bacterium]
MTAASDSSITGFAVASRNSLVVTPFARCGRGLGRQRARQITASSVTDANVRRHTTKRNKSNNVILDAFMVE